MIYLDFNRTTPLSPSTREAMDPFWTAHFMLPGQEHPHARAVAEAIEAARERVASMVGCEPFELVFTGGGTEANNLAILGAAVEASTDLRSRNHLLVCTLEHDSVLDAARSLVRYGWEVETFAPGRDGVVDPDHVAAKLRRQTRLVCLQLANPILGTLQPVRQVADRCHSAGVRIHCDTTQAFGKLPVDVRQLRVDTAAISGHKFYGPKGSGAVFVRRGLTLAPIGFGESREMGLRPGSENVPGWIGLGAAADMAGRCADQVAERLGELRDGLIARLVGVIRPAPRILCQDSPRLPNTVAVEMPIASTRIRQVARDLVVTTARASDPPDECTRALRSVGSGEAGIARTICISLGWTTSQDEVDRAGDLLADAADGRAD